MFERTTYIHHMISEIIHSVYLVLVLGGILELSSGACSRGCPKDTQEYHYRIHEQQAPSST
jgi:hypothetical protein